MFALDHRVRVFVFQFVGEEVRYLLLRHKPAAEWPLGPVVGTVGIDEHLKDTILREVRAETGLRTPHHILDLSAPQKELFGDVGLVEWPFAWQAGTPDCPAPDVHPGPTVGEYAWMSFDRAFHSIESQRDRDTLVRLQLKIAG